MHLEHCIPLLLALVVMARSSESEQPGNMSVYGEHGIIPDVIDNDPLEELTVKYGETVLTPGMDLTPIQSSTEPETVTWNAESNKTYALMMLGKLQILISLSESVIQYRV
jgi:hypothetical protein